MTEITKNPAESKSPTYVLLIDETRDDIMSLLTSPFHNPLLKAIFLAKCAQYNIKEEDVNSLVHEMSDKSHAMGWCKDPDCRYKDLKKNQE